MTAAMAMAGEAGRGARGEASVPGRPWPWRRDSELSEQWRRVDVFWCAAEYRYRGSGGSRDSNVPTD